MLKFKGWCAENGVKQAEIADFLGITVQTVNRKMNGRAEFTLAQVKALCQKYNLVADIFF